MTLFYNEILALMYSAIMEALLAQKVAVIAPRVHNSYQLRPLNVSLFGLLKNYIKKSKKFARKEVILNFKVGWDFGHMVQHCTRLKHRTECAHYYVKVPGLGTSASGCQSSMQQQHSQKYY